MFDWQDEIAPPAALHKATRVAPPATPVATPMVSFAQALTTTNKVSSNDNLPLPLINGEKISIKISQDIYEKGTTACKLNLQG